MARGEVRYKLFLDVGDFEAGAKAAVSSFERMTKGSAKLSGALGGVSTTLARSATAFGLPIGPLKALDDVADVAALGLGNLSKAAAGFSGASLGVAGAGLAVGSMLGTLIRSLPGAAEAYDALAASALGYFHLIEKNTGPASTNVAAMGAIQAQVQQNVINLMKGQGKTIDEIVGQITGKHVPAIDKVVAALRKDEEATRKATAAKEKAKIAEEEWQVAMAKVERVAQADYLQRLAKEADELAEALKKTKQDAIDLMLAIVDSTKPANEALEDFWKNQEQLASDNAKKMLERIQDEEKAREEHWEEMAQQAAGVANILSATGDLFVALGVKGDSMFVKLLDGFAGLAGAASGVFSALAKGDTLGAIGAGISGIAGFIGSVFGDKEQEKVNDMRDAFFEAEGGFVALQKRLLDVTDQDLVKKIFDAKTVDEFNAAVSEARGLLDLQTLAQEKLQTAMERYGITVGEMGGLFAQQKLDEQALQLWGDWELLNAAMGDTTVILTKMAPSMQEYIDTAIQAGATIPNEMKSIIEQMIALGLLTDENGEAFESLEDAGLKFGGSLEDSMKDAADAIKDLVRLLRELYGLPPLNIPVTVGGAPPAGVTGGPPPGEDPGGPPRMQGGGHVWKSGLAYLHAGEDVVPYGDVYGGPAPGTGPVPFDPGGNAGPGAGGVTGGPAGGPAGMAGLMRAAPPISVHLAPGSVSVSVSGGSGNPNQIARAVQVALRDNLEGLGTAIGRRARAEIRRR